MTQTNTAFEALLKIMAQLRGAEGCPWDKQQTHESLKGCLLEETYEVLAAIDSKEPKSLREELGDLLLQVVFHAQIAQETEDFNMSEIIEQLNDKLTRRHPHVFGKKEERGSLQNSETAISQWEKIKASEKPEGRPLFSGLPHELPALLRSYRMGAKASQVGFDWPNSSEVWEKVEEELSEFKEAIETNSKENREEELGDLFFSLAQVARFFKVNPEEALRQATYKFQRRFEWMENKIKEQQQDMQHLSSEAWERLWQEAKLATATSKSISSA